jgi:hypothetical protein
MLRKNGALPLLILHAFKKWKGITTAPRSVPPFSSNKNKFILPSQQTRNPEILAPGRGVETCSE